MTVEEVREELREAWRRVQNGTDPVWEDQAKAALIRVALEKEEFISDDVWDTGLEPTRENRALGPIFMAAKRAHLIEKTDRVRPSVRSHLSGKPVWRSLIVKNTA